MVMFERISGTSHTLKRYRTGIHRTVVSRKAVKEEGNCGYIGSESILARHPFASIPEHRPLGIMQPHCLYALITARRVLIPAHHPCGILPIHPLCWITPVRRVLIPAHYPFGITRADQRGNAPPREYEYTQGKLLSPGTETTT